MRSSVGNNRVTYKDIMDFQEKVFSELTGVRGDIAEVGKALARGEAKFEAQDEKIEINRKNIIRVGGINLSLAAIGSYIATKLGLSG